jgi:hypothetical protein
MKSKLVFAKAMLQTARMGATRALDAETRQYAAKEEARWEREVKRLEEAQKAGDAADLTAAA